MISIFWEKITDLPILCVIHESPLRPHFPNSGQISSTYCNPHYLCQVAKKIKEKFLKEVSRVVVKVLDPFRRPDVKKGHIKTTEDFKHLAKKVSQ